MVHVLTSPNRISQSRQDTAVYLFYRADQSRLLCVVIKRLDGEGFLVTAYPCNKIKEGESMAHIKVIHDPIGETLLSTGMTRNVRRSMRR